jgi:hypothetical protein
VLARVADTSGQPCTVPAWQGDYRCAVQEHDRQGAIKCQHQHCADRNAVLTEMSGIALEPNQVVTELLKSVHCVGKSHTRCGDRTKSYHSACSLPEQKDFTLGTWRRSHLESKTCLHLRGKCSSTANQKGYHCFDWCCDVCLWRNNKTNCQSCASVWLRHKCST